jgi:hypothetical protein
MNDFSELENELKKLRPAQPSAELSARIDAVLAKADSNQMTGDNAKVIHPARFKVSWLSLGLGLAAAAIFLIFARIGMDRPSNRTPIAKNTPAPRSTIATAQFIPAGATQVVYNTRDEGLHFPAGYDEPMRRVRYQKRETLQWRNPNTGASLRVSYPSEEVVLIPVSGQ